MLRVSGRNIVDDFGRSVTLRGFNFWGNDVFLHYAPYTEITLEDLQRIKAWGFNTVKAMFFWSYHIEPDESQPGVYNETNLARIEQLVQDCQTAGLNIIFSSKFSRGTLSPPYWAGWALWDDMLTAEGLNRYATYWDMMLDRFNGYNSVIGYDLLNYPYHAEATTPERTTAFYDVVMPKLLQTVRAKSSKILFFSPIHKGTYGFREPLTDKWVYLDSYFYANTPNEKVRKIADDNVVYMQDNYGGLCRDVVYAEGEWDYDVSRLEQSFDGSKEFSAKYNVPIMVDEGGIIRPHSQSQLDMAKAILNLRETFPRHWLWTDFSNSNNAWGIYDDVEKTVEGPLIPIIRSHFPPTPRRRIPLILAPLGVGVGYLLKRWFEGRRRG